MLAEALQDVLHQAIRVLFEVLIAHHFKSLFEGRALANSVGHGLLLINVDARRELVELL